MILLERKEHIPDFIESQDIKMKMYILTSAFNLLNEILEDNKVEW
jgi:hypothetical protein